MTLQVGGKYVCATCGKQFLQRMRYMTHVDRHQNVRRHICTTCGKAFTYKYSLWSHAKKCNGLIGAWVDPAADHVGFSGDLVNTTNAVGGSELQRSSSVLDDRPTWETAADTNKKFNPVGIEPSVSASLDMNQLESV